MTNANHILSRFGQEILAGTQLDERQDPREPCFYDLRSLVEYRRHADLSGAAHLRRVAIERLLAVSQRAFTVRGFNALIGRAVDYAVNFQSGATQDPDGLWIPNYRE